MKKILVTGGAGYIGSHTVIKLLESNYKVIVVDNLSNSSKSSIEKIKQITNKELEFYKYDIRDFNKIKSIFDKHNIDSVIHFAGLKAVGESVENPIIYYSNNVCGTCNLLKIMKLYNVKEIVFSSSATVYGQPKELPLKESSGAGNPTNPYGRSKLQIESILSDLQQSDSNWSITILRYFNPVGAHESGLIGENPNGIPNNLMPYISQVAIGKLDCLTVHGQDYNTPDGTGIRDYIHVSDLADGHIAALSNIEKGLEILNLGTGKGISVLQLIKTFEEINNVKVPYIFGPRRDGDIDVCYSDVSLAKSKINWTTSRTIIDMCRDEWRWQRNNIAR